MKVPEGFKTRIAGDVFQDTPNLVVCFEQPLLTINRDDTSGRLLVNLSIFDSAGVEQARIEGTQLTQGSDSEYSVMETGSIVSVRDRTSGRVICELKRRDSLKGADLDAYILTHAPDGFLIHASPVQSNIQGKPSGKTFRNLDAALEMKKKKSVRKKR